MKFNKAKLPSRHVSVGIKSAPHRSMYYAMGLKNADIKLIEYTQYKHRDIFLAYQFHLEPCVNTNFH